MGYINMWKIKRFEFILKLMCLVSVSLHYLQKVLAEITYYYNGNIH